MKYFLLGLLIAVGMVGCEDRYRYPCQDPANTYHPDCIKPACLADSTCPEYLVETDK